MSGQIPVCPAENGFLHSPELKIELIFAGSLGMACLGVAETNHFAATNLWQADVGHYNQSSPAMDTEGVIYVTSWDGHLYAVNPDGTSRWVFRIGFESVSTPAVGDEGTIYFGSRDHRLYAVDSKGREKWKFKTGGWVDASPALGLDGTVYFGSWDKKFYALDGLGRKKWEFTTGGPIVSSAAIDAQGVVYFGSDDGKLYALNADGTKRWEQVTRGAILSSPSIAADGAIYFTSVDGSLYAINPDGSRRWELRTGSISASSPVIGLEGTIYLADNTNCCAVSPEGKLKWQWPVWNQVEGQWAQASWVALANGSVLVVPGGGDMAELQAGKDWVWHYWLSGPSVSSPLIGQDGTVYQTGIFTGLHAIERNVPPAKSSWPMFQANPQRTGRVAVTP
jgi:outer membrane protein assembly factor BamB